MKLQQFSLRGLFLLLGLAGAGLGWWRVTLPREPIDLSADDLKVTLNPQKPFTVDLLPRRVRNLAGYRGRIEGFIYGGSVFGKEFTEFILSTEPPLMTYGSVNQPDSVVAVRLQSDSSASYTTRPVIVTGVLRFEECRAYDKELVLFYRLDDASLEPTALGKAVTCPTSFSPFTPAEEPRPQGQSFSPHHHAHDRLDSEVRL